METKITREEVKKRIDGNRSHFHLVEVLDADDFNDSHLPYAINVPVESPTFEQQLASRIPNRNDEIVVYCKNKDCDASKRAANRLKDIGYRNVKDYEKGKEDWKEAGYPIH